MASRRLGLQKRFCMTHMYADNFPKLPAYHTIGLESHTRSKVRGTAQKWDPDWVYKPLGDRQALKSMLNTEDAEERIKTYKLERMDYVVREVPYNTAPPPPMRELSARITLDLL
ncbi:hypothetical protein DIPPA_10230 [Diplonema papillatum]|nr:hypothetical protein DIPPA_10230 [Diplonema papillatum]